MNARLTVETGFETAYYGATHSDGRRVIIKADPQDDGTYRTATIEHHVRHSPGGFGWGFIGDASSELARCMIIDALGDAAACDLCEGSGADTAQRRPGYGAGRCPSCFGGRFSRLVEENYQRFAHEVIARLPAEGWGMSARFVREWLGLVAPSEEPPQRIPERHPLARTPVDLEYLWRLVEDSQSDVDRLLHGLPRRGSPDSMAGDDPPAVYAHYLLREALARRAFWTEQLRDAGVCVPTCDSCGRVVRSLRRFIRNTDGHRVCRRSCGLWPVRADGDPSSGA
jgi:hypothetical protein